MFLCCIHSAVSEQIYADVNSDIKCLLVHTSITKRGSTLEIISRLYDSISKASGSSVGFMVPCVHCASTIVDNIVCMSWLTSSCMQLGSGGTLSSAPAVIILINEVLHIV